MKHLSLPILFTNTKLSIFIEFRKKWNWWSFVTVKFDIWIILIEHLPYSVILIGTETVQIVLKDTDLNKSG